MTTPANWGELIAALGGGGSPVYGTATVQTATTATAAWADLGVPFVKGNGMAAGGSGATRGIQVQTAGFYEIHTIVEGVWTSGQSGGTGVQLVRPRGTDYYPQVSDGPSTFGSRFVTFHHVGQFQASDVIRIRVAVDGPSPQVRYARITARLLGA